jgi:hypothetical protein
LQTAERERRFEVVLSIRSQLSEFLEEMQPSVTETVRSRIGGAADPLAAERWRILLVDVLRALRKTRTGVGVNGDIVDALSLDELAAFRSSVYDAVEARAGARDAYREGAVRAGPGTLHRKSDRRIPRRHPHGAVEGGDHTIHGPVAPSPVTIARAAYETLRFLTSLQESLTSDVATASQPAASYCDEPQKRRHG